MKENRLSIYFIHSRNFDYNNDIYLPVLRSNVLSKYKLIFPETMENKDIYYKDLMDTADLFVIDLTKPDIGFNMELKQAVILKKPTLVIAKKSVGYDEKYQKLFKDVIAYETEEDVRTFVEKFVTQYNGKIEHGKVDSTVVLGVLN